MDETTKQKILALRKLLKEKAPIVYQNYYAYKRSQVATENKTETNSITKRGSVTRPSNGLTIQNTTETHDGIL